jgi:predicted nucleic acid-binding protein
VREAVCDAGPLIHLDEAGLPEALEVFRRVVVPSPVADEVRAQPRGPGLRLLKARHVVLSRPSGEEMGAARAFAFRRLGPNDRLLLAMAQAREAPLLTDDLDVREAAKSLDLEVAGTIGLVLRAATRGLVTRQSALAALDRLLSDSSMFITKALIERAKAALSVP